jgi:hypothetical protein
MGNNNIHNRAAPGRALGTFIRRLFGGLVHFSHFQLLCAFYLMAFKKHFAIKINH